MTKLHDIQSLLRRHKFARVEMVHLTRAKPQGNRARAKAFANDVDKALAAGFQDRDVVLVALTVDHTT